MKRSWMSTASTMPRLVLLTPKFTAEVLAWQANRDISMLAAVLLTMINLTVDQVESWFSANRCEHEHHHWLAVRFDPLRLFYTKSRRGYTLHHLQFDDQDPPFTYHTRIPQTRHIAITGRVLGELLEDNATNNYEQFADALQAIRQLHDPQLPQSNVITTENVTVCYVVGHRNRIKIIDVF